VDAQRVEEEKMAKINEEREKLERQLRDAHEKKALEKQIDQLRGHTIVCGLTTTREHVLHEHRVAGRDVVVVDPRHEVAQPLRDRRLPVVVGDPSDEAVLARAGLARAASDPGTDYAERKVVEVRLFLPGETTPFATAPVRPDGSFASAVEIPGTEGTSAATRAPARTSGADWLGRGARALARRAAENARAVRDDGQRSGETRATRRHCVGLGGLCRSGSTSTGWCCAGGFSHSSRPRFCSGPREGAAMALVWTPIETMFLGVVGIVRCTIMLSLYTGMARGGGCGAWISSSIIMWKDHW
jgi:hypothetical protein